MTTQGEKPNSAETLASVCETRNAQQSRIEDISVANDKLQADIKRSRAEMQHLV